MFDDDGTCIRCCEGLAVDDKGMCGGCHWEFEAELEELWHEINRYLSGWAGFHEWEEARA